MVGAMLRHRSLLIGIFAAGTLVSLLLFWGVRATVVGQFRQKVEADTSTRIRLIEGELENVAAAGHVLQRAVSILDNPGRAAFSDFALQLQETSPYVESIVWASATHPTGPAKAPQFTIQHVVSSRSTSLEAGSILALPAEAVSAVAAPRNERLAAVCSASADGRQVALYLPVFRNGSSSGSDASAAGVAVLFFSPELLIRHALRQTRPVGIPFDIIDVTSQSATHKVFHWSARLSADPSWRFVLCSQPPSISRQFAFADRQWKLVCSPNKKYVEQNHPLSHWIILASGLVLSLSLAIYISRLSSQKQVLRQLNDSLTSEIDCRMKIEAEQERTLYDLQHALDTVKTLEGILPICASCKKIRDDKGEWTQVDTYITRHSDAEFSHGICPECARRLYPDFVPT